jgi:PhnB protein
MKMAVYVNYRGVCEDAFRYYEEHLGGRPLSLVRHGGFNPNLPEGWSEKVLHARMEIGSMVLLAADIPVAEPMRSAYLTLLLDSEDEAERVYGALADGGQVFMRLERTPFANRFAQVRDRFGVNWMLLHQAG